DEIHAIEASGHIVTNVAAEKKSFDTFAESVPSGERRQKLSQNEIRLILKENEYLQKENEGLKNQIEKLESQIEAERQYVKEEREHANEERQQARQEAREERQQARQERQNLQKIFLLIIFILFLFLLSCQFGFTEYSYNFLNYYEDMWQKFGNFIASFFSR
ncbi:16887_t:CDS:2, partial [Dentiscutata heterogama]